MGEQRIEGSRNVQLQGVVGSRIQITYGGATRTVPLEPAHVPVAQKLRSPARLIRAHAGVIPYVERSGVIGELEAWIDSGAPFSGQVIDGRGGAGKTRLAVELCQRLEKGGWLCGFLVRIADQGMLDSLVEVPIPRLVVIDYAETRPEQVELLLPLLSARASLESPVRALLLVRGSTEGDGVWAERLANRVDSLDAVLDECEVQHLEETQFGVEERRALFEAAVPALAERLEPEEAPAHPPDLTEKAFGSPLMVVIAAYLAALGKDAPTTREELLKEVLAHERRYWREGAEELGADDVLLERMVALATLLGANTEEQAERHLGLLRYLKKTSPERRNRFVRWVRAQYPGPRWWNPLEPDLVGEYLIARCFSEQPEVLRGALSNDDTEQITRPLEVLSRTAADYPRLAEVLAPILSERLEQLCRVAVTQAETARDADLLYGKSMTVAAAIAALLRVVKVDGNVLPMVGNLMPPRSDLVLNDLAVTLTALYIEHLRSFDGENPAVGPHLASGLNNLSNRLADAGRQQEALVAIEESVQMRRSLIDADPTMHAPYLASALNNLSSRLEYARRYLEALTAIEESVATYRSLSEADPDAYTHYLASALNNLSNRLARAKRYSDALAASEESIDLRRPLAEAEPAAHGPYLASALHNLSNRLAEADRQHEALAASEESVATYRSLVKANPAAYLFYLASALNNLSNRLADAKRQPEALTAIEESVATYRSLSKANPAAYAGDLAGGLINLSNRLADAKRQPEALTAIEESVATYRSLSKANPSVYEPYLAQALNNFSNRLVEAQRHPEALAATEELVQIRRSLAKANPTLYAEELARALSVLAIRLDELDRNEEAEAARGEAIKLFDEAKSQGYTGEPKSLS